MCVSLSRETLKFNNYGCLYRALILFQHIPIIYHEGIILEWNCYLKIVMYALMKNRAPFEFVSNNKFIQSLVSQRVLYKESSESREFLDFVCFIQF